VVGGSVVVPVAVRVPERSRPARPARSAAAMVLMPVRRRVPPPVQVPFVRFASDSATVVRRGMTIRPWLSNGIWTAKLLVGVRVPVGALMKAGAGLLVV
jgi:hypothetical protein